MLSPLQFNDYRLLHLLIDANEKYIPDMANLAEFETCIDFEVYQSREGQKFKIPLSLKLEPVRNRKYCPFKK